MDCIHIEKDNVDNVVKRVLYLSSRYCLRKGLDAKSGGKLMGSTLGELKKGIPDLLVIDNPFAVTNQIDVCVSTLSERR